MHAIHADGWGRTMNLSYFATREIVVPSAALSAVLVAGWNWTAPILAPGWFIVILLAAMTVELWTHHTAVRGPNGTGTHDWAGCVQEKLLLLALVAVALLLDLMVILLMRAVPDEWAHIAGPWGAGVMVITISTQVWLIIAEAVRIVDHVAHRTGQENIPPVILWVIRQLRRADRVRWQQHTADGAPPPRRWYEDLTEEDVQRLLDTMEQRKTLDTPPEPLGDGPSPKTSHGL